MTRILSFIFSVFYVTLTFLCHKVTWFSIACIASALLLIGLKKNFNDNPKRFLLNHGHFGAALPHAWGTLDMSMGCTRHEHGVHST